MPYLALCFDTAAPEAERWADALLEAGALCVDSSDANAGTPAEAAQFGEPGAMGSPWPLTRLSALFDAQIDVEAALLRLGGELGSPAPRHTIDALPETDWVRKSQSEFAPVQASERVWIVPSWCEPVVANAINLRIDPGLAFGTGSHATTRLCIRWLDAHLAHGVRLLDYGCGSGVLAIAAAKLGAVDIWGVDIDLEAVRAGRANAVANAVNVWFGLPHALRDGVFDVVIANILANPLELLAPLLAGRVRVNGTVVLSGILESQAAQVVAAYVRWFNIDVWEREEGWVALAGRRKRDRG